MESGAGLSPDVQSGILEFLKRRVKPGGLVYVTYNLMTQWAMLVPLQAVLRELAASSAGGRDVAIRNAFAIVERLTDSKVIPASLRNVVTQLKGGVPDKYIWAYLAHEFLPEHWKPTSHAEVARALGLAKLKFAGSADLLRNLSNVFLNEGQHAALTEVPASELREFLAIGPLAIGCASMSLFAAFVACHRRAKRGCWATKSSHSSGFLRTSSKSRARMGR